MSRKILLTAALTAFLGAYGLAQSNSPATPATPTADQPYGGPLISTPNVSLPNPQSTAGISDAGRAGISVGSTTEVAPAVAAPEVETGTATTAAGAAPVAEVPAENDLVPSGSVSSVAGPSTGASLAEIAGHYKAEKGAYDARVLTNDNVQYALATKDVITMASNEQPIQQDQNGQPQSTGVQAQSTAPSTASAQSSADANQTQTAPTAATQDQPATAGNATTPQINQNQQTNDAAGTTRLPATSTLLPLLSLMGLASGGLGLWFRKFKK